MRIIDVEQGSPEWTALRVGRPTTSRFHRIITEKKLGYAGAAKAFIAQLLAEQELEFSLDDWKGNDWSHRGTTLEAKAVSYYEMVRNVDVERVGFIETDDRRVGCSPDGLVGNDGGLEIKCFEPAHHTRCLLGYEDPVKATQLQGSLWITGRKWWDVLAYSPVFPPVLLRVERDEKFIAALDVCMTRFLKEMDEGAARLASLGPRGRVDNGRSSAKNGSCAPEPTKAPESPESAEGTGDDPSEGDKTSDAPEGGSRDVETETTHTKGGA